jgi:hypothetical protein
VNHEWGWHGPLPPTSWPLEAPMHGTRSRPNRSVSIQRDLLKRWRSIDSSKSRRNWRLSAISCWRPKALLWPRRAALRLRVYLNLRLRAHRCLLPVHCECAQWSRSIR